jgi:hypothetical protein
MRRTTVLGSILLPAVLLAAGCSARVPRAGGPAGPVTASPTVSSAPTAVPSQPTTASPATAPATTAPATSASPAPTHGVTSSRVSAKVLGPYGLGPLKLHMSSEQASATGLIDGWQEGLVPWGCRLQAHLLGGDNEALVGYDDKDGVEVITAYPGISTPQGIHDGSTKAQLIKAYPDWTSFEGRDSGHPQADGRGDVFVPGNHKAVYEIVTAGGRVTSLVMYSISQMCFG